MTKLENLFFLSNNFYIWSLWSVTDLIHCAILCEAVCLSNPPSTGPNALLSACVQIPPRSPWDKLPPLPSIQARVITLSAGWQACIGWSFVNRRRSRVTAQPFLPSPLCFSPPPCFDLSIRTGDLQPTTVATLPSHHPISSPSTLLWFTR